MPVAIAGIAVADILAATALGIVLYAAGLILVRPLAFLLSNLPVIGDEIHDRLIRGIDRLTAMAFDWAKSGLDALVQIVAVPVGWLASLGGGILNLAGGIVARIGDALAWLGSLAASVAHSFTAVAGQIATLAGRIVATAASIPGIAADVARTVAGAIAAGLNAVYSAAIAGIRAAVAAEQALIARWHGDLLALITGQVAVMSAALNATATTLRQEWATDLGPINLKLDGIGQVLAPVLALDLAIAIPRIIAEIRTMRRDCVDPLCSVLGPALGSLGAVQDIATLALVGGLVGEAIANPAGTARVVAGAVDTVHSEAADLLGLFTGARA